MLREYVHYECKETMEARGVRIDDPGKEVEKGTSHFRDSSGNIDDGTVMRIEIGGGVGCNLTYR